MIESDIRAELITDVTINSIVNDRVFLKSPIRDQGGVPYLTFSRKQKFRDMVSQEDNFEIWAFSQDTLEIENLCDAVIKLFEDKRYLNTNPYYSISLVSQTDSREKLDDGYFWSVMVFKLKHTT